MGATKLREPVTLRRTAPYGHALFQTYEVLLT